MQNKIKDRPIKAQNELAQHLIKKKKSHRKYTITKKISSSGHRSAMESMKMQHILQIQRVAFSDRSQKNNFIEYEEKYCEF